MVYSVSVRAGATDTKGDESLKEQCASGYACGASSGRDERG